MKKRSPTKNARGAMYQKNTISALKTHKVLRISLPWGEEGDVGFEWDLTGASKHIDLCIEFRMPWTI